MIFKHLVLLPFITAGLAFIKLCRYHFLKSKRWRQSLEIKVSALSWTQIHFFTNIFISFYRQVVQDAREIWNFSFNWDHPDPDPNVSFLMHTLMKFNVFVTLFTFSKPDAGLGPPGGRCPCTILWIVSYLEYLKQWVDFSDFQFKIIHPNLILYAVHILKTY